MNLRDEKHVVGKKNQAVGASYIHVFLKSQKTNTWFLIDRLQSLAETNPFLSGLREGDEPPTILT